MKLTGLKRIIVIIITTIIVSILLLFPICKYAISKTTGQNKTDCMVQYIDKYYPNGSTYLIEGKFAHIDKKGIGNPYMIPTGDVDGCTFSDGLKSKIFNTPYCYLTLVAESTIHIITNPQIQ